ncbi:hypothetical protein I4U23_028761 [Adineta vaga]|nr:hypothetical protein I4U23_028761 [Adineta vaga]
MYRHPHELEAISAVAASSPSRTQASSSPSRTRSVASPARTRSSADSPSTRRAAAASPSSRRATASPSRTLATSSPSRTRASASTTITTTTSTSATKTRSKQTPHLIELSDSDNESSPANVLTGRTGSKTSNVQTRSIAVRHQNKSATSVSPTRGVASSTNMTNDVEQSIARHRREIKQLLDSARDRNSTGNTPVSSLRSGQQRDSSGISGRPHSPSPTSKSRTHRQSSKSGHDTDDDDDDTKKSSKSDDENRKKSSSPKRGSKSKSSCCNKYFGFIKKLLKLLIVSSILVGGLTYLYEKRDDLFPRSEVITCSIKNATECEDMKPVIIAVRKQLQVRTGEVDCGFRAKTDALVTRAEIEKYLDEKGLKFQLGQNERWNSLLKYIKEKPISDILLWTENNQQTNETVLVRKLSTKDAVRSLTCRARQDVNKTLRNLALLILGSSGLFTLAWLFQKQSKTHENNEATFKNYLKKTSHLLKEQYEKHINDPNTQPCERLKHIWERVKKEITKQDSRIRGELQDIDGKASDVWRWIKSTASSPKKLTSSPKDSVDESDAHPTADVGLTECLKLRNCFHSDNVADDEEIDHVVDSIQHRCANVKRVEHIGIHSVFVYLKFSSKEAAAQGYHLLNNWRYQNQTINVKYIRLNRYYEHFPEAQDTNSDK